MKYTLYLKDIRGKFRCMMFLNSTDRLADIIGSENLLERFRFDIDFSDILKRGWEDNSIFDTMYLSEKEFVGMINDIQTYRNHNIEIKLPSSFGKPKPKFKIELTSDKNGHDFTSRILCDGEPLTEDEYRKLTLENRQMVFIRDSWVEADVQFFKKFENTKVSINDVVNENHDFEVKNEYFEYQIKNPDLFKEHQISAMNKILTAFSMNRNILLADDMGLGKTATVVGTIASFMNENTRPVLIVVPKSLVGNWKNEFIKFSNLKCLDFDSSHSILDGNVYVTTYGYVLNNQNKVSDIHWDCLILDEAQQIKNFKTKISSILCDIRTNHKIAMTGTPIENTIRDFWSIFKFLNPEILGSVKQFESVINNSRELDNLIKLLSPYIIRRMKSDITDINLGKKHEFKIDIELSESEKLLYNSIIDKFKREKTTNKTTILGYLTSLKQVCGMAKNLFAVSFIPSKLIKLKELIIKSNYEKFVVFTQYIKTATEIDKYLENLYGQKGAIINGNLTAKERTKIAEDFQNGLYPYIVLTLKSGNCGLTLTTSHNLVHYDRWWNPAVENQATDRIYRIGQKNEVNIYKFIAKNSIESKIDEILDDKNILFDSVVNAFIENKSLIERI